jgi:L-lactate dehydrogenase (cytochrome)
VNEIAALLRRQIAGDLRALPARGRRLARCLTIEDLRTRARRAVPRAVFDFVDGAAGDEVTARRNREDLDRLAVRPRVLAGAAEVELATTVLGRPVALPVLGAPTGLIGLVHPDGEAAVAAALHAAGSVYVLSCMSSCTLEEVTAVAPGAWFQVYLWRDQGLMRDLVERARAAGCAALMVTVDVPFSGLRLRDARNGWSIPPRITPRMLADGLARPRWSAGFLARPRIRFGNVPSGEDAVRLVEHVTRQFDPAATWEDVARLAELWDGPVVVKGVLRADDAARAVEAGAGAVVVSNHGGRQLDGAVSSIGALPAVVDAVGDRAEVYVDSGIRRGVDVVKALALGARACLAGRPFVYGLAAGGRAGVDRAVEIFRGELALALALSGARSPADAGAELLSP